MGVTGLWKLIEQSGKPVPLDTLQNKVLAVDISIWLHQVVKGFQDSNGATLPNAHLLGLFHRLCKLMYYRIRPVFVFDGGVPPLKRETIAKRARNKNKYQNEADKLQQMLLEALAKEKVVQEALGPSTSQLIASPRKAIIQKLSNKDDNDLFKLPPMQEKETDDSLTDVTESDSSFDEKRRTQYNSYLHTIDVKSSYFQSLPADIRHEILTDLKETRKQSSWGRLHELPAESQSFSSFQMNRLLRRRQVQVELEGAEKEMGGRGLSMAELENLLSEEGVVDPDIATDRIASNEHSRYIHVRDISKALKKDAEQSVKEEHKAVVASSSGKTPMKVEPATQEDFDLQKAIQLSLGFDVDDEFKSEEALNESNETVKLTKEQIKALGPAATSLARSYMIEYGGMNDDDIADLVKFEETIVSAREFKFNDDSILIGNETAESKPLTDETKPLDNLSESSDDVSSNADSDFIDVPEIDSEVDESFLLKAKEPFPLFINLNDPSGSKDKCACSLEVVIDPNATDVKDDIFADIFEKSSDDKNENASVLHLGAEVQEIIDITESDEHEEIVEKLPKNDSVNADVEEVGNIAENESVKEADCLKVTERTNTPPLPKERGNGNKIESILSSLDNEMESIKKMNLNDLLGPQPTTPAKSSSTTKALDVIESTPPKVTQPFFVKKTPPSSKKKSTADKTESNMTPSKVAKSLTEKFESMPSTSSASIERDTIRMAADVLREKKSKEELEEIADHLNLEQRDIIAERNRKDRLGVSITEQMSAECMELLRLFGVPYVVAPMEAEAQCAYLNEINLTDGTITDDSDIWLFGGKTVYKNFFDSNKLVMEFKSNNIEKLFHLSRPKLIQLSFLVGSDYTQGIHGVGAVTALEVLSMFNMTPQKDGETTETVSILSSLRKFRDWWQHKSPTQRVPTLRNKLKNITITEDFPNPRVADAYLYPTVDENRETFSWGHPELENLREYAKKTFGWTTKRADDIVVPVIKRLNEKTSQSSIQNYFKITDVTSRKELVVSKRVRLALHQMSGDPDSPSTSTANAGDEKKVRRKRGKKAEEKNDIVESPAKKPIKEKRIRKRKIIEPIPEATEELDLLEAGTSTATVPKRKITLPDNNEPIPQREVEKRAMQNNKLKAIEVLKKQNKSKSKQN